MRTVYVLSAIPIVLALLAIVLWANGVVITNSLGVAFLAVIMVIGVWLGTLGKLAVYRKMDEENGRVKDRHDSRP